ncbi:MAG: penicillin-binding transpeptidase domain-containing protein [bacterium]|nr:penicillin-binding transpeptidase domain-containing protein [bacterium]MDY4108381.1 penicillin-binding transpeptidase domain-containing protein [Bacilli bacterium]
MKRRLNVNKVRVSKLLIAFILLFFVVVIARLLYLGISPKIDGIDLKTFVANRNTRKKTTYAKRGTIYDSSSNVLARTINSYTVIAYLSESRSKGFKTPQHVVDKEKTAKELSPILGMSEEAILYLLNRNAYQVELGPGGRGITELKKEEIEKLKLPGISFISSYKRYYQNDDFASYILGYVKTTDDGEMIGEMGIEQYYNDMLKGKDGFIVYQQDVNGYKIPNTKEELKESKDGVDIYLTIDSNIQFFVEKYSKEAYEQYPCDWLFAVVADAKTGAILGSTSYPSFNPNIKNITNYLNPLVSFAIEPGSTMKIFTYMATMEKKMYDGNKTFKSGSIKIGENTIYDWKTDGFGEITYDEGFMLSSNVGISYLTKDYFTGSELKEYFKKWGFGQKTGIELPYELTGTLNEKNNKAIEIANAGFGQGITITPIQMVQALTMIANNGVMLKPYIVSKIVDEEDALVYEGKRTELGKVASSETVNNIKELMYKVIYNDLYYSTGASYRMDGYDLIGKTGTAQYTNPYTGRYYYDNVNYIRSFAGMFPKDDPEIIIYVATKKTYTQKGVSNIVKGLVKDIANYRSIFKNEETNSTTFKIDDYSNQNLMMVLDNLKDKFKDIVVIGDGDKIVDTYPKNKVVSKDEKIFILTNSKNIEIPDFIGYSKREVDTYKKLTGIDITLEGNGYVYEQNKEDDKIYLKLKDRYVEQKKNNEDT